jgi:capsular polysaccharide biosynthesis protein
MSRLSVNPITDTRVIAIAFEAGDPQLAADIANAVAAQYIAQQREVQRAATAVATDWLQAEIDALSARVVAAEEAVETFRADNNLFLAGQTAAVTITSQRLADASAELARVRTSRVEAESKAALIRTTLERGGALSSLDVLNSPVVANLREQEVAIRGQIAEASATLMPGHPQIRALNAQLADIAEAVRVEAMNVLAGLETEAQLARAYEAQLAATEAELRTAAAASSQAEVQLRALEREATAERDLLETYLALSREAVSRQNASFLPVNVRVVSPAAPALEPSYPKPIPMSIIAAVLVMMLGAAIVLVRELASGRATRPAFIARPAAPLPQPATTPAPPLVAAPPLQPVANADEPAAWSEGGDVRRMMPRDPGVDAVAAQVEQALGGMAAHIRAAGARRVLITMTPSALSGGRPLAAVALARALSRTGPRVLLVDLHGDEADRMAMGEAGNLPGFGDLFAGEASFAQVIFRDRASPAHFIPAGRRRRLSDMMDGDRMATLVAALDQTYDHVVYDIGPEMLPLLGPGAGMAVVVTDREPSDPETTGGFEAVRAVSEAEVMVLVAEAAVDERAGAAA